MSTSISKKIKAKLKRRKTGGGVDRKPNASGPAQRATVGKTDSSPENLSGPELQKAVGGVAGDINRAKSLPGKEAGLLARVAFILREALLEMDGQRKDSREQTPSPEGKKAAGDYNRAKNNLKPTPDLPGGAALRAAGTLARKKPEDMTAGEIRQGIEETEKAIEEGKALLPADAGILQRALFALKQALFELADVDPELAVANKDELEKLIASKTDAAPPAPAAVRKVTEAVENVNQAQEQVAENRTARGESVGDKSSQALKKLKQKKPEELTAVEIRQGIEETEEAIKNSKALLPADASLLQRALFALKMALFELGGVDPELAVKDKDELERLIAEKSGGSPTPEAGQNVKDALDGVNRAQAQVAARNPAKPNEAEDGPEFPGLERLKTQSAEELTAEELTAAIDDIERSIEKGKVLLPENASIFQRALYALLMALFELGGIDPELRYEDQERLEEILKAKETGADGVASAEQRANLQKAKQDLADAERAVQGSLNTVPEDPALAKTLGGPPELKPEEIRRSVAAVDRTIKKARLLVPEGASIFLRAAYILREALLRMAGDSGVNERLEEEPPVETDVELNQAAKEYKEALAEVGKV